MAGLVRVFTRIPLDIDYRILVSGFTLICKYAKSDVFAIRYNIFNSVSRPIFTVQRKRSRNRVL